MMCEEAGQKLLNTINTLRETNERLTDHLTATVSRLEEERKERDAATQLLWYLVRQIGGAVRVSSMTLHRYVPDTGSLSVERDVTTGDIMIKAEDQVERRAAKIQEASVPETKGD